MEFTFYLISWDIVKLSEIAYLIASSGHCHVYEKKLWNVISAKG